MTTTDPSIQTNPPDPLAEALLAAASHGQRIGQAMTRTATTLQGQWASSVSVNRTRTGDRAPADLWEAYPTNRVAVTVTDEESAVRVCVYLTAEKALELAEILKAYAAAVEAQS